MKKLFAIATLLLFQAVASGQTVRFLGYFSPTNEVVTPTNWIANAVTIRHLTNTTAMTLGTAGVRITTDGDGAITILGEGNGSDEDLTLNFDDTANTISASSSTGVTDFDFGTIDVNTDTLDLTGTGTINGLDAIDTTTENTLEGALEIAGEVTGTLTAVTIADSLTVSGWSMQGTTTLGTLAGALDAGAATSFEVPNAAAPTTDAFGEIAGDNNAWAVSRGTLQIFDGTANTWAVNVLASDAPSNGQVPKWNTGGTITWEDDANSGSATAFNDIGDTTGAGAVTLGHTNVWTYSLDGGNAIHLLSSDLDNAADTTLLRLGFNADNDANSIFAEMFRDENGTPTSVYKFGATAFTSAVAGTFGTGNGQIDFGTAGVRLTSDGDGAMTWLGLGDGSDEDLTWNLDDVSNSVGVSSSTGVTVIDWGVIGADYDSVTVTLSTVSGAVDAGAATSFEVPNGANPTTDAFGEVAADNDAWAASRGALEHFDGTASTFVVATLVSDAPSNGQVPKWNTGGTITWEDDTQSAGSATTFNNIGDSDNNGSVTLGHTNIWDFTLDGSRALTLLASDLDNAADTTLFTLSFNDAADANSIAIDVINDVDGTPASVFKLSTTALTTSVAITPTGAIDAGGAASLEIPNGNDPDLAVEGQISYDANGDVLRAYDGANQVAIGRKIEAIHVTVVSPNDLADSERDAFWTWSNESGMSFIVTGWKGWSDTDDTDLNIEEIDADGQNNATVDAVTIATNGTGLFTGSDTTITAATIENGHLLVLDFDDTDTPGQVKMTIFGYYNADVN